jgi:hypothetical protein
MWGVGGRVSLISPSQEEAMWKLNDPLDPGTPTQGCGSGRPVLDEALMQRQPRHSAGSRTLRDMNLSLKSLIFFAVIAATAALLATGQPAHAEDRRPCVSKREFYGARDFAIPPMGDPMTRVPLPPPIGRLELERRWDVRHRGAPVTYFLGGGTSEASGLDSNPMVRVKMYRSCEMPLSDLQVYVGFHKDTNLVLWTMWWPSRLTIG